MEKELLETYIQNRLSTRRIAAAENVSQATIKYWLKKYDLKTNPKHRTGNTGREFTSKNCRVCSRPLLKRLVDRGSSKCDGCSQKQRRYLIKEEIVRSLGGKCNRCGWKGPIAGFDLHHKDPSQKEFALSAPNNKGLERLRKEVSKCELLCALCHRLEHDGITEEFLATITDRNRYEGRFEMARPTGFEPAFSAVTGQRSLR